MAIPLAVLIVEDSDSDAQIIVRLLNKGGYETTSKVVETAEQMRAALEQATWDIIVSDYNLPHFDGHAALMLLKETGLDIPFIAVSGAMGEETAVAMMKAGAQDYLMKGKLARLVPAIERELRDADTRRKRKRAEEELQKLQKLQSVGTLAGGIAHDFNNILLLLFLNISLAKDELTEEHPGFKFLEDAENAMNRAVRLTQGLLTFAPGGSPLKENVNLGTLVEEAVRLALSGSNVKLFHKAVGDLWMAEVDKGQIQQVVSNLTINARQAMPEGGRLYVTLENADVPEDAIPGVRQGKYVKVVMRDEGTGIDKKHMDRIFDPYFTTKKSGSGLGLATAFSIISRHGGHIGVVSELGKESIFTFYLPASEPIPEPEPDEFDREYLPSDRPAKVLVMDDEEEIRELVATMLTRCGFSVATASDGREAIGMYKKAFDAGEPYSVVIMDLAIPGGIGGKEAIKELLAIDPQVRAVISSGYGDDPVMANYALHGFKGIAPKPYTTSKLREVVGLVLKG